MQIGIGLNADAPIFCGKNRAAQPHGTMLQKCDMDDGMQNQEPSPMLAGKS